MDCIQLGHYWVQQGLVNTVMDNGASEKLANFLISSATIRFSTRILLLGVRENPN
jgi:hypothetical protein